MRSIPVFRSDNSPAVVVICRSRAVCVRVRRFFILSVWIHAGTRKKCLKEPQRALKKHMPLQRSICLCAAFYGLHGMVAHGSLYKRSQSLSEPHRGECVYILVFLEKSVYFCKTSFKNISHETSNQTTTIL